MRTPIPNEVVADTEALDAFIEAAVKRGARVEVERPSIPIHSIFASPVAGQGPFRASFMQSAPTRYYVVEPDAPTP